MSELSPRTSLLPHQFHRAQWLSLIVGGAGIAACLVVWIMLLLGDLHWPLAAAGFYKAYLFAILFWLGLSLGAMMGVMTHHLTGGEWGYFVRRIGEAAAAVIPLLFVLFIPILIGLHRLYPWADPHYHNVIVNHKKPYLNPGFFVIRTIIYFTIWIAIAWALRILSIRHDRTASRRTEHHLRVISAAGLVIYFITMSFACVDWIMSMEPEWYSTIFGFIVCVGQAVTGVAAMIIVLELLSRSAPFAARLQQRHFNDLATLLITCIILWAYNAFFQLLVIWMGNVQGEISWYVKRSAGVWRIMAMGVMFLGFLAPFLLLLQRGVKKRGNVMLWICIGVLLTRLLDLYWMIAPSGVEPYADLHWLNVLMSAVALLGIGGLWVAAFLWLLNGPPLMPMGDRVPIGIAPPADEVHLPKELDHGVAPGSQPGIA